MSKIKVGDILYGTDRMLRYEVLAIIDRGNNKQYEVECKSCNHGHDCTLLVTVNKQKEIVYVGMVGDDDHYYFHTGQKYYKNKEDAYISRLKETRGWYEEKSDKAAKTIQDAEKHIAEIDENISMYEEARAAKSQSTKQESR